MTRLLLFVGAALLWGGVAGRHLMGVGGLRLRHLGLGWLLLFVGTGLSAALPLREVGLLTLPDLLDYLTGVEAGRAALLTLLGATLLLAAEVQRLPLLVLTGLALASAWGMAGIGHGGIHGANVRGLHALHALSMAMWVGGLLTLWPLLPAQRLAAARHFSPLALTCVGLLTLTGLGMGLNHLPSLSNLQETSYGQTLLLKLLAFVGVLAAAGWVRRSLTRERLATLWPELLLLALVLLLTARLGGLPLAHG